MAAAPHNGHGALSDAVVDVSAGIGPFARGAPWGPIPGVGAKPDFRCRRCGAAAPLRRPRLFAVGPLRTRRRHQPRGYFRFPREGITAILVHLGPIPTKFAVISFSAGTISPRTWRAPPFPAHPGPWRVANG